MYCSVTCTDMLAFLDTIPQPLGLADALKRRELKEKEVLEPLLSTPRPLLPTTSSFSQSLSITLPSANGVSVPVSASTSASNAPSPRPSIQSISQASASTSKPVDKSRRQGRHVNGDASASTNGATSRASEVVNGHALATSTASAVADDAASISTSVTPSAPMMPRRQSLREPKPRRRPDGQDVPPRPAPPPPSPVKEPKESVSSANGSAKGPGTSTRGGKGRVVRAKSTKGKTKSATSPMSVGETHSVASGLSATARNGINHAHLHANGSGAMMTRSRRGSAIVQAPSLHSSPTDNAGWPPPGAGHFTGPGSVSLDSPAPAPFGGLGPNGGLVGNPGRTIYSQQRPSTANASR